MTYRCILGCFDKFDNPDLVLVEATVPEGMERYKAQTYLRADITNHGWKGPTILYDALNYGGWEDLLQAVAEEAVKIVIPEKPRKEAKL